MSFWENETCNYCEGVIEEQRITLHRRIKGKNVLIEDVPVGVCTECGARFYDPETLKSIENRLRNHPESRREELVPVYSF